MQGALIILLVTIAAGVILYLHDRRTRRDKDNSVTADSAAETTPADTGTADGECCGMHITCEKDTLLTISDTAEYYEDEDLDRFRGRDAGSYSNDEIEEFREVLLTLRPEEIASWARSLNLRQIVLPEIVKTELLMIVAEQREARTRHDK